MSKWIMSGAHQGGAFQLFCFPFAGGGASAYRNWLQKASYQFDVSAIQLPGRENRIVEPLAYSMTGIINTLVEELCSVIDRPFVFFGHSMGARMAFEVAREMKNRGYQLPVHLFVSGSRSPEIPEPRPLHQLSDDEFCNELGRFGGTPRELLNNRELMELYLPILRADFTVDETYDYVDCKPLPVPVTAFCGTEDPEATQIEMLGWKRQTTELFNFTQIQGDHFFIQSQWAEVFKLITETVQDGRCAEHSLAM